MAPERSTRISRIVPEALFDFARAVTVVLSLLSLTLPSAEGDPMATQPAVRRG